MKEEDLLNELRLDAAARDGGGRRRWPWVIAVICVLALGSGAGFYVMQARALAVDTVAAQPPAQNAGPGAVLEATGYVTARREATVSSKITGKLLEVNIEEGDRVKEGQVLARLDDSDAKVRLSLSRAEVAAASSNLGQLQAQLRQARRDLKRQGDLKKRGLTSEQALEDAQTKVSTLSAQLDAQRMQVRVAAAQLDVAQVGYDDTIIRAPFSGVVVAKAAQPGEIVSPMSAGGGYTRTGIGTIVDMDSLEVEVDVNEAYIHRVKPDQPAVAVLNAYPEWKIPAHVIAIIPTADRSKATVKVRVALEQKDPRILPDMGVRVSFLEQAQVQSPKARGVLVPGSAIVQRDGRSGVFVVDGDRVRLQPVTAGQSYGDLRLVAEGLAAGERVVRDPPARLKDGDLVKVNDKGGS